MSWAYLTHDAAVALAVLEALVLGLGIVVKRCVLVAELLAVRPVGSRWNSDSKSQDRRIVPHKQSRRARSIPIRGRSVHDVDQLLQLGAILTSRKRGSGEWCFNISNYCVRHLSLRR